MSPSSCEGGIKLQLTLLGLSGRLSSLFDRSRKEQVIGGLPGRNLTGDWESCSRETGIWWGAGAGEARIVQSKLVAKRYKTQGCWPSSLAPEWGEKDKEIMSIMNLLVPPVPSLRYALSGGYLG